jgi:predicted ArsR family transcriptional regulator
VHTFVDDIQNIGEVETQAFGAVQQGRTNAFFTLKNEGVNTVSYRFQQRLSGVWTDVGVSGTDYNNTLTEEETVEVALVDLAPQTRLLASASGGSVLKFAVARYAAWAVGEMIPLMSV